MKRTLILGAVVASMVMSGCGSSNDNTNNQNTRFTTMVMMGDTIRQDNNTKLEWIGSSGNGACKPHGAATTEAEDIAMAQAHCEALEFAGHTDWRMATKDEHSVFIVAMDQAGIIPFYANPACPRLIGIDGNQATAVNTHNSTPIGGLIPWENLLQLSATNYGVKCVRSF